MSIEEYLESLIRSSGEYELGESGLLYQNDKDKSTYILNKLYSKRYRKWKLDSECKHLVESEVSNALRENRPIKVFFAQGAYKLWRVKSSPGPNWAEFFNISYLLNYLAPIASIYKPGVELTYYFLTVLPQTHNNLSQIEVDHYTKSFKELLGVFQVNLPANLKVNVLTDLDVHTRNEYEDLLAVAMTLAEERFYAWPQVKQADYIRRAWLNIKWKGVHDWSQLSDDQRMRMVKQAVLYEYAATQDILLEDKKGRGIILSTLPKEDSIGIGSTYTSVAKHWVGEGVVESENGEYFPRILSPSQYDLARLTAHNVVKVSVIDMQQFSTIEVFSKRFDFTQR